MTAPQLFSNGEFELPVIPAWDDVAAEIRQRYGLDYKPSEITAGMRGPYNHVLWPCPTVLELVDFSHVAGGV